MPLPFRNLYSMNVHVCLHTIDTCDRTSPFFGILTTDILIIDQNLVCSPKGSHWGSWMAWIKHPDCSRARSSFCYVKSWRTWRLASLYCFHLINGHMLVAALIPLCSHFFAFFRLTSCIMWIPISWWHFSVIIGLLSSINFFIIT